MERSQVALLAAAALAWSGLQALASPADARAPDGLARITDALSTVHLSDDATAIAGLVLLACARAAACVQ